MNLAPGVWPHGTPHPPRLCVHEDERGRRCGTIFTPTRNQPVNTNRCPKHRGRLKASADNYRKRRRTQDPT